MNCTTQKRKDKHCKVSWEEKVFSVVTNGWADAQRRPLINFMAATEGGAVFMTVVNCEGEVEDNYHIAKFSWTSQCGSSNY